MGLVRRRSRGQDTSCVVCWPPPLLWAGLITGRPLLRVQPPQLPSQPPPAPPGPASVGGISGGGLEAGRRGGGDASWGRQGTRGCAAVGAGSPPPPPPRLCCGWGREPVAAAAPVVLRWYSTFLFYSKMSREGAIQNVPADSVPNTAAGVAIIRAPPSNSLSRDCPSEY